VGRSRLPTPHGPFVIDGYRSLHSSEEWLALHCGDLSTSEPVLARVHSQCVTGEVFGSTRCDCGAQLQIAMERIGAERRGAIVYQLQEGRGIGVTNKVRAYALQDEGADTIEANHRLGFPADLRSYWECAEILWDLGVRRVRLLSNNPAKVAGLEEFGICVCAREPIEAPIQPERRAYLLAKKEKLGHLLAGV
jgi:3,4-dihydroxy 2-butanone 4-phosphate synthase/GTP cyclohydrolase II